MEDEGRALLESLIVSINKGDENEINRLKYRYLFYGSNLLDIVINYIFLNRIGVEFDFGYQIIKKGTKLYRIRTFNEKTDFSQSKEWNFPPFKPENRANKEGEAALYLGSNENLCLLETHIKEGQKYVLGEYIVQEDLKLGGFFDCEDRKKASCYLAGVILNAYLIAPSRSEKNKELFGLLDEVYKNLTINDLQIAEAKKISLPLKFGVINKRNEFYKTTNRMIEAIKSVYPDGISYSSCYIPAATIGITCNYHNVALYERGMGKIKFCKSTVKTSTSKITDVEILKTLIKDFD